MDGETKPTAATANRAMIVLRNICFLLFGKGQQLGIETLSEQDCSNDQRATVARRNSPSGEAPRCRLERAVEVFRRRIMDMSDPRPRSPGRPRPWCRARPRNG